MKVSNRSIVFVGCIAAGMASQAAYAGFTDTEQERQERWHSLQQAIFGERTPTWDAKAVVLDAPGRALDAALVPITVKLAHPENVKGLYLVIDDNPSPVAAHFTFGPDSDPSEVKLRVRINTFTDLHAVAEMKDGSLVASTGFVKASGGCSAPMGVSDEEAMRGMGDMRLKLAGEAAPDKTVDATLMIRHPNFNGMQMNDITRDYTPARYIQSIEVAFDDRSVFKLDTDISLASNPVLTFGLRPHADKGALKVDVRDSQNERWAKSFDVPAVSH